MADERFISNEFFDILLRAHNRNQASTVMLLEDDGTLRTWSVQVGQDADGNERPALIEADRTSRQQMVLWDPAAGPAAPIRWRGETLGEAAVSLHGADEADNLDNLRTDPDRVQWTRPYEGLVQVDPVEVPVVEGVLWDPGAVAAQLFEVSFLVVNNDAGGVAVTVSIGVEIGGGGGGLAAPGYWMFNEIIPYPGSSGWRGPFVIAGDDDVRGVAGVANDASISFRIKRVDLGA